MAGMEGPQQNLNFENDPKSQPTDKMGKYLRQMFELARIKREAREKKEAEEKRNTNPKPK